MKRTFPVLLFAFITIASGCESDYTYVDNDYGQSFEIKKVSWAQDLSEYGKTLRWEVEFENESGFRFSGPNGIGIHFVGSTEGVTADISSYGFTTVRLRVF